MNRGKLAVVSMVLLALVMAGFAWWWNYERGRQSLAFWGKEAAQRIESAPDVELWWLRPGPDAEATEQLPICGRQYAVASKANVSQARGLIHARHALLVDASFVWEASAAAPAADYTLAVRFRDASGTTTVAFDFERLKIAHVETGREQQAVRKIIEGWQMFADRYAPAGLNDKSQPR